MTDSLTFSDEFYMRRCLALAARGLGRTSPNPAVGSLVLSEGKIVGSGWHRRAGSQHAEVVAIESAGSKLENATLYVTLEPCNHFGSTPPCTKKILESGISKVVFSVKDPNPNVCGAGAQCLSENNLEVVGGVLEDEVSQVMKPWLFSCKSDLPYVTAFACLGFDSRIVPRAELSGKNKILDSRLNKYLGFMDKFVDGESLELEDLSLSKLRDLRSSGVIHLGVFLSLECKEIWSKGLFNELIVCRALAESSGLGAFADLGELPNNIDLELRRFRKFGNDTVSVYGLS